MLSGHSPILPLAKPKHTFQLDLRNADEYQRPDRLHFLLVSYLGWLVQERRREGGQVSLTSDPASACQRGGKGDEIHPANATGLMLVGLKPAEPQIANLLRVQHFRIIKKYKSSLK